MLTTQTISISQLWKELRGKYDVMCSDKPLSVGITEYIAAENPELKDSQIQAVLRRHTRTDTYLRNVKFGDNRYDLRGVPNGVITDVQRELARLHLNERSQNRLMVKINEIKPAKTEKKRLAREARHNGRLIKIRNNIALTKVSLAEENIINSTEFQCSLAGGDVGFFNN